MTPPAYTLTSEQLKRLHGACNALVSIKTGDGYLQNEACYRAFQLTLTVQIDGRELRVYRDDAIESGVNHPPNFESAVDGLIEQMQERLFDHTRPQLRKHLASLPAHALRKSIHQIEDEWLNVLDKQWLDFVAREIQLAQLENAALITE